MDPSFESRKTEEESLDGGTKKRNSGFSTTVGTYVTLIGYSAGMSDFWRFPYLVYRNGGGAFLIPFILTTCICGIPLFFLEYTLSNFSGKGPYRIWDISPLFRGIGVSMMVAFTLYIIGCTVFRGWLIYFLVNSFRDPLPWTHCNNTWNTVTCKTNAFTQEFERDVTNVTQNMTSMTYNYTTSSVTATHAPGMTAAEEYWQYDAIRLSSGFTDLQTFNWAIFLCIVTFRILVFLCMIKSIKSIEKIMFVTTFLQFTFILVVFIRSLTLQGAADGLARFFGTDFEKLSNPRIWIEAFLMAFYTMSFGWGSILTLGSHAKFKENSLRTCYIIPLIDGLVAIIFGVVCFSVLGNMAHAHGVHVDEVISAGMSVGVVSYITALASLPFPQLWSAGFLISVILSGIDSQVVPVEMCLQIIGEIFPNLFPKYRLRVLVLFTVALIVCALPTATGAGAYIFLWIDWYAGVWSGPICAFLEIVVVAWIYGIDRFNNDIMLMIGRPIPAAIRIAVSFITPCLVLMIFITSVLEYVPPKYGTYEYPSLVRALGWLLVAFILSPILVVAVIKIAKQTGTFTQRIKKSTRSSARWGPKENSVVEEFENRRTKFQHRTIKEIMYFALFGHYTTNADLVPQRELSDL